MPTANEVLASVDEDHDYQHTPADMNSTPGIQREIARLRAQIKALADHVDGKPHVDGTGVASDQRSAEAARIEAQKRQATDEWKDGTPPGPNGPDDFGTSKVQRQTPANVSPKKP